MQTNIRLKNLRQKLSSHQAILLTRPADIRYFSGYDQFLVPEEREGFCLITTQTITVMHPSMNHFIKQPGIEYKSGFMPSHLAQLANSSQAIGGWKQLLIDEASLFLNEYRKLVEAVGDKNILAIDRDLVWNLRMIKSPAELKLIRSATKITEQVQKYARKVARVGMTELELAHKIENQFKKLGGWPVAFPTIVAFGKNSALPHYQPGSVKLKKEMAVLIDCGATVGGYHGDMTRSFWFGKKPPAEYIKISKIVKDAFEAACGVLRPGTVSGVTTKVTDAEVTAAKVDQAARKLITQAGYGEHFMHTTGHGLGLEIHEPPSLNSRNQQVLKKNMVVTVEPGIYLEDKFGVRHENVVVV